MQLAGLCLCVLTPNWLWFRWISFIIWPTFLEILNLFESD